MNLYRFDDPTKKPDLSKLNDQSRFLHPRYQGCILDVRFVEGGGGQLYNFASLGGVFTADVMPLASQWTDDNQFQGLTANNLGFNVTPQVLSALKGSPSNWSFVAKLHPTAASTNSNPFGLYTGPVVSASHRFLFYPAYTTSNHIRVFYESTQIILSGAVIPDLYSPHVYGWTSNGSTDHKVFVDGIVLATYGGSVSLSGSLNNFEIGHRYGISGGGNSAFVGYMDWIRFYARTLVTAETESFSDAPFLEETSRKIWMFQASPPPTVSLSGSGQLETTGVKSANKSAVLSGSGGIVVTGSAVESHSGSVVLDGSGVIATTGIKSGIISTLISGSGQITTQANKTGYGSTFVSGSGLLDTATIKGTQGVVVVNGSGSIQTTGGVVESYSGSVAVSCSGSLSTSGVKNADGTVGVGGHGVCEALGIKHIGGEVSLSGGGYISLSAVKRAWGSVVLQGSGTIMTTGGSVIDEEGVLAFVTGQSLRVPFVSGESLDSPTVTGQSLRIPFVMGERLNT